MTMKIQFPVYDNEGKLKLNKEVKNDECLEFFSDGHIESNGGRVEHHEIDEESLELLSESDRENVKKFLSGNYEV